MLMASAAAILIVSVENLAWGQTRDDWRATENIDEAKKPQIEEPYHGVTPGSGNNLPKVAELKNKPGTWVTWPGFLMLPDGSSRVFLQTTGPMTPKMEKTKKIAVVKLGKANIHLSNNKNPLVTTHFNTPLDKAYLKKRKVRRKTHVELILELKSDVTPQISQTTDEDGYHYVFFDFSPAQPLDSFPSQTPSTKAEQGEGENLDSQDKEESAPDQP